jgi:hypothetical protein
MITAATKLPRNQCLQCGDGQKSTACTISTGGRVSLGKDGHAGDTWLDHKASGETSPNVFRSFVLSALMSEWTSSPYSDRESSVSSCDDVIYVGYHKQISMTYIEVVVGKAARG